MSGKRAKRLRREAGPTPVIPDHIDKDHVPEYLQTFFKGLSGFHYISLDPVKNGMSWIKAHKTIAVIENGTYVSPSCRLLKVIHTDADSKFGGFVVSKEGQAYFGDPFVNIQKINENNENQPSGNDEKFVPSEVEITQM